MMDERETFPMIPESNWWRLRDQFRKTLPQVVNPSYLKSLLNLNSDQAARNLIPPLKRLKLIDDQGKPTSRANNWRNDLKYDDVCQEIVSEVYPVELRTLMSGPNIDRRECEQWFMDRAALGEQTAYRAASLYILLNTPLEQARKDAERKQVPAKATSARPRSRSAKLASNVVGVPPVPDGAPIQPESQDTAPSIHIDLQIHISPEADAAQIDNIFASIAKHLCA